MCGICGFTGYRQDQKTVIERMMKAIEHRGPDSEGSFCREKITLGFRRLSIFDLEDGDFIFGSGDTGFDSDGHMMSRMSDNMAFDLDTGEIHMVSGWDDDDEDDW